MRHETELSFDIVESDDGSVIAELYRGEDTWLGNLDVTALTPTERETLRLCFATPPGGAFRHTAIETDTGGEVQN